MDPFIDTITFMFKLSLCVLLTQMGKTFTAIKKIYEVFKEDDALGRSIHFIFTMNTLLNNKQFAKRLEEIEKKYGPGSVCIFSSKYDGKYAHVKNKLELQGRIMNETSCPRVVIMCSNPTRFSDGLDVISVLNKNTTCVKRVLLYFDELHEYINDLLRSQIEQTHNLDIVKGILALTASPANIWKKSDIWSNIKLLQIDEYGESDYVGYKDMNFMNVDDFFETPYVPPGPFDYPEMDYQTIGFIDNVLSKYPDILADNTRSFIPAHKRRSGHYAVRDLVFNMKSNAIVIVLNGVEKSIQYKDLDGNIKKIELNPKCDKNSTERSCEEVCETISRLINQHALQNRPIVITGLLCVGMGQTLTHSSLGSFTSAIFGHMDLENDEIYQLFGRITGRMKSWVTYTPTTVYCPTIIMNRCSVMEECARNMATEHNGEIVTLEDYMEPMHTMGEAGKDTMDNIREKKEKKAPKPKLDNSGIVESRPFTRMEDVKDYLAGYFDRCIKLHSFYEKDGYKLSTRLNAYYKKDKEELLATDRLTATRYKEISLRQNISSTGNGQKYMVYPVYETMETPREEVRYYVRHLKIEMSSAEES